MHRTARIALCALLAFGFLFTPLGAARPASASVDQARDRLFTLITSLRERYPLLRDRTEYGIGALEDGQTAIFNERFEAGTRYLIVAVGCDTAEDVDVGVFTASGETLESDTDREAAAAIAFEPKASGRYVVGVNLARSTAGEGAHYAYQVFYVDEER